MSSPATIVETADGRLFRVTDAGAGLDHAYSAVRVRRVRGGFADAADSAPRLIRRAGTRVVAEG